MNRDKLVKMSDLDLRQVKVNAIKRGRTDIVEICDELLIERHPRKTSKEEIVSEFHFVCRKGMNLSSFGNGLFKSGQWLVAEEHCEPAKQNSSLIALHEEKSQPSYFQGKIVDYERVFDEGAQRWRVVFTVDPTSDSLLWYGDSAGEKGYKYE